jgi:hypothetical protein
VMWGTATHHRWRKEIESGPVVGPRMVIGSPLIDGPTPVFKGSVTISGADEARQAVLKARDGGAEFIKVYERLPRDAFFAIADESRKLGIPFVGHAPISVTVQGASAAGLKSLEHDRFLYATTTRENDLLGMLTEAYARTSQGFPSTSDSRPLKRLAAESLSRERARGLFAELR